MESTSRPYPCPGSPRKSAPLSYQPVVASVRLRTGSTMADHLQIRTQRGTGPASVQHLDAGALRATITRSADQVTVAIAGELDLATAPVVSRVAADVTATPCARLVVDLGPVSFVDSSGLAVLLRLYQRATNSGTEVRYLPPAPLVMRPFEISGLDGLLPFDHQDDNDSG